jgi:hypothetical protein
MKEKSLFKNGRLFILPTLIAGTITSAHIFVNVYDYKLCRERHHFFDLDFASYYQILITIFHIICTLVGIVTIIILLTPDDEGDYQKMDNKGERKLRKPLKIFKILWFGFSYIILGFQ